MRIFSTIVFLFCGSVACYSEIPASFELHFTDARLIGTQNGRLKIIEGEKKNISRGRFIDENLLRIDNEDYQFIGLEDSGLVIASSENGNVKYIIDFKDKTFSHGQVTILMDKGIILTKSSIGTVSYSKK